MHKYIKIIKDRWDSSSNKKLFIYWIILRIKKLHKINFQDKCHDDLVVDVVIPTISKDFDLLGIYLDLLKNNICHKINKIYIVSNDDEQIIKFCQENNINFINEENLLGYGREKITYNVKNIDRRGWILQQLIKLSGDKFVKMKNYIIVDSDTLLINKHNFVENNKFVLLENEEWNEPYFESFEKIFGYKTKNKLSFTSHMMIFNVNKLKLMKKEIEEKFKKNWDQVYISMIDQTKMSCISDYELYGDWMLYNFPDEVTTKPLYNKSLNKSELENKDNLINKYNNKYKSLSFHNYIK